MLSKIASVPVQRRNLLPSIEQQDPKLAPVRRFRRVALFLSTVVLFTLDTNAGAVTYRFTANTDLPRFSRVHDINNLGQVVGHSSGSPTSAFMWDVRTGTTRTLDPLSGSNSRAAYGINDTGQIVGYSWISGREPIQFTDRATIWNANVPTALDTPAGYTQSRARAINNSGQVVGDTDRAGTAIGQRAVLWNGTTPTELPPLGGNFSDASAINDAGQVVGGFTTSDFGSLRGAIWNGTTGTELPPPAGGGPFSYARAINDAGQVVGFATAPDFGDHATLWNGTTPTILPSPDSPAGPRSDAFDINSMGQVVGSYDLNATERAALWNDFVLTDLDSVLDAATIRAGWTLDEASGINDSGWITGIAYNSVTNRSYIYVLSVVPEPAAGALMLAGLVLLSYISRRRKHTFAT